MGVRLRQTEDTKLVANQEFNLCAKERAGQSAVAVYA